MVIEDESSQSEADEASQESEITEDEKENLKQQAVETKVEPVGMSEAAQKSDEELAKEIESGGVKIEEDNNMMNKHIEFKNKITNKNEIIDFEDLNVENKDQKVFTREEKKQMESLLDKKRMDAMKSESNQSWRRTTRSCTTRSRSGRRASSAATTTVRAT